MTETLTPNTPLAQARLLIIDDDQDLLTVLSGWFARFCGQVYTASNGSKALEIAGEHALDVILTDLKMPGFDGLQLLSMVKELHPNIAVVFLTGEGTKEDAILALREGRAFDFLQKPVRDFKDLNHVIERAHAHSRRQAAVPAPKPAGTAPLLHEMDALSARELDVLTLLAQGLDNRVIADRLILSDKTIKNHLTRIYEKLHVSNRLQAVMACQTLGII